MTIQDAQIILMLFSKGMEDAEIKDEGLPEIIKAHNMAIRSLKAWDDILDVLKKKTYSKDGPWRRDAYFECIDLIEKKLQEVTRNERSD
jgi:hypothetical protein